MQCVFGAAGVAAGWGRPQHQRPHPTLCYKLKTKFFRGSSASAITPQRQLWTRHCCAYPEQHLRRAGKRANFSAAKNLPFCTIKPFQFTRFSRGEKPNHKEFN